MRSALVVIASILVISVLFILPGCDKERIVTTTEYIQEIEYIEHPPDTVTVHDTVALVDPHWDTISIVDTVVQVSYIYDTMRIYDTVRLTEPYYDTTILIDTVYQYNNVFDTMFVVDTVLKIEYHYETVTIVDTVYQTDPVYDTVVVADTVVTIVNHYDTTMIVDTIYQTDPVYDTVVLFDTVVTIQQFYDTTYIVDTVGSEANPNALMAYTAMQYYSDPMVIDAINQEFGIDDGWIFYLSIYTNEVAYPSTGVFDIYGQIDYWTPDWSAFYPFEYFWRMTYISGDPSDPRNWEMSDPPGSYAPDRPIGVNRTAAREPIIEINK